MTEMIELADMDLKTSVITIFKKLEEILYTLNRDMEEYLGIS